MAVCSSLSLFPPIPSQPKTFSSSQTPLTKCHGIFTNTNTPPRFLLKAGFNEIEPDLNEDQRDVYATNGIDVDKFEYGIYDGHHTYNEGEQKAQCFSLLLTFLL
ncbi:hypothetical protein ACSQ67_025680 [Phaseolus vulgaris]